MNNRYPIKTGERGMNFKPTQVPTIAPNTQGINNRVPVADRTRSTAIKPVQGKGHLNDPNFVPEIDKNIASSAKIKSSNMEEKEIKPQKESVDSLKTSEIVYDKTRSTIGHPYTEVQNPHSFKIKPSKIGIEEKYVKNISAEFINKINLSYAYGTHVEQGRVVKEVDLPMDRSERAFLRGQNEREIRNSQDQRPLGLYFLSGVYGKDRMDYNRSLAG